MRLHPACKIFPRLSDQELQELADDIAANGLRNPIVTLDGKVLDGCNRLEACKMAGVEPRFVEFEGDDPVEWVVSQNLVRRHLTASQRAVVAFDLLPLLEKEAKERQRQSKGRGEKVAKKCATFSEYGKASEIAARIAKTNSRYVEAVKAINNQAPELVERVRSGELNVMEAQRIANYNSAHEDRPRVRPSANDTKKVICGDCKDLIPTLKNRSVNLVVTSPPYAEQRKKHYESVTEADYPYWTVKWMRLLRDKLADDGSVLIVIRPSIKNGIVSDYVLRTRIALRDDGWNECDELIWLKPDAPPLGHNQRPRRAWESVLWFSKSTHPYCNPTACGQESERLGFVASYRFGPNGSLIATGQNPEVRKGIARCTDVFAAPVGGIQENIQHPAIFPVSLAEQLILTFSRPGDLVLDCFCGSGSTLCAAKNLDRHFQGFDINKKYVRVALQRLAGVKAGK